MFPVRQAEVVRAKHNRGVRARVSPQPDTQPLHPETQDHLRGVQGEGERGGGHHDDAGAGAGARGAAGRVLPQEVQPGLPLPPVPGHHLLRLPPRRRHHRLRRADLPRRAHHQASRPMLSNNAC